MFKSLVNEKEFSIALEGNAMNSGTLNDEAFSMELIPNGESGYHIIKDNRSYNVDLVEADYDEKKMILSINGNVYEVDVRDRFDVLLKQLGMDIGNSKKVNELKAPMPGLVLDFKVSEGDTVKKGDALMVLEAMKMENILKSPTDGVVKRFAVSKGDAVEKNQLLLEFES